LTLNQRVSKDVANLQITKIKTSKFSVLHGGTRSVGAVRAGSTVIPLNSLCPSPLNKQAHTFRLLSADLRNSNVNT